VFPLYANVIAKNIAVLNKTSVEMCRYVVKSIFIIIIIIMNVIKVLVLRPVALKLKVFLVFPYPTIPKVVTGKPASVGGFYLFIPSDLTISFGTILYLLLYCSLLIC
jgi:hypothetical protein